MADSDACLRGVCVCVCERELVPVCMCRENGWMGLEGRDFVI